MFVGSPVAGAISGIGLGIIYEKTGRHVLWSIGRIMICLPISIIISILVSIITWIGWAFLYQIPFENGITQGVINGSLEGIGAGLLVLIVFEIMKFKEKKLKSAD